MSSDTNRPILVMGNWKMNGLLGQARERLATLLQLLQSNPLPATTSMVLCPTHVHLQPLIQNGTGTLSWGAQDLSAHPEGAHTGEVSGAMLSDIGCSYVLVGHSERRTDLSETSELVSAKAFAAISASLIPVVCVGETLAQREAGQTQAVLEAQLLPVLQKMSNYTKFVVAYEPVWAIGTGQAASPEQADVVHLQIREFIGTWNKSLAKTIQILYGGSVKVDNAKALLAMPNIDGFLVGGASLDPAAFFEISQMG